MSRIILQESFSIKSDGDGPKDHYDLTVQVIQRYDMVGGKTKARGEREINLSLEHRADDVKHKVCDFVCPLGVGMARRLRDILDNAIHTSQEKEA